MIRRRDAHELIAGLSDDAVFGPVMLIGAGGVSVEVVADKALELPPLDLLLARDMIARTRVARLLAGYRDRPAADVEAVALTLVRLSHLAADFPQIRALDVNPLLADAGGVIALDARIMVAPAPDCGPGANPRFALRPYPSQWERIESTRAGERLLVRPVRPEDETLYATFFDRLTPQDRRYRFFSAIRRLPHAELARLTQLDYARAMAFVALDPADGALLGVSRLAADADGHDAEFAVVVRSDAQGRGLGRLLMERLIAYGRSEGLERLFGHVAADNDGMQAMCRRLGFTLAPDPEDPDQIRATLELG